MANKALKPEEIEYIRQNCMIMSDVDLATHLNRDVRTISKARKNLGVIKGQGGKLAVVETGRPDNAVSHSPAIASHSMDDRARKEFFKTQLSNSLYYQTLKQQLTDDEIGFYLEEWASLCVQFEDIVATEKRQIDELIKAEIMGNRILRNIKIAELEIEALQKEIEEFRKSHDMENSEEAQERDLQLMNMVRTLSIQSAQMSNDYQKNVNIKNDLLEHLNGRRRDRIDHLKRSGTTILGIISAFRDREVREAQGRHMELERLAKEKKKAEWRKPIQFPDGTMDCILFDEHSEIPKKDIVRLEDISCKMLYLYKDKPSKILIVDNDNKRIQFFQDQFKKGKLDYASNVDKALDKLKSEEYDLVCLDYDLGLDQKGLALVDVISQKKEVDVLIHSMNPDGARRMKDQLVGVRNVETFPFEELVKKTIGDKNAKISTTGPEITSNRIDA